MNTKNEWLTFFREESRQYEEEVFTKNTDFEVDFLLEELNLPTGSRILDMGCGIGRHSLELARKGYSLCGVDISPEMLAIARSKAERAGLEIEWVLEDAVKFRHEPVFDAAICLCEGALCLLGAADDPFERDKQVLQNIFDSLKPGAKLVVNALNVFHLICKPQEKDRPEAVFDPIYQTADYTMEMKTSSGEVLQIPVRERLYTPVEFMRILRDCGFEIEHIWGGTAGSWGRRPLKMEEIEMMVVARKPA